MASNTAWDQRLEARSGSAWGWILAYAILVILIGFVALANPIATGLTTGVLLGVFLIGYGVLAIVSGVSSLSDRGRWTEVLLGVLGVVTGGFILFNPFAGAISLVWALGFWLLVSGIFQVASAIRGAYDRGWRLALGVLDILLGGYLLFAGPATSLVMLATIVGISFIFRGVFLAFVAFGLRKLAQPGRANIRT